MFKVNPFRATGLFLNPLKTWEYLWFPGIFQEVWKETTSMQWVKDKIFWDIYVRTLGGSQTLEGQVPYRAIIVPYRAIIVFTKWKSHRTVGGAVNLSSGVWGKARGVLQIAVIQRPKWLEIKLLTKLVSSFVHVILTSWREGCSSSTFNKMKKVHTNVAESHWVETHASSAATLPPPAVSTALYLSLTLTKCVFENFRNAFFRKK